MRCAFRIERGRVSVLEFDDLKNVVTMPVCLV
jgi:hypothetical protein